MENMSAFSPYPYCSEVMISGATYPGDPQGVKRSELESWS